jgi:cysteine desulfurase
MIYLDNLATTQPDPRVLAAAEPYWRAQFGNPHSAEHALGRQAAEAVEHARAHIAALIGAEPREIIFTSGATEANNLAIKGAARFAGLAGPRRIITLATEHKCVLESVRDLAEEGFEPCILPPGTDGRVDLGRLRDTLRTPTLLVSLMLANNETGVIQDIAGAAALCQDAGALLHADLAQGAGKIPVDVDVLGINLGSISGHKLHGPKGIGALYVRRRPRTRLKPLFSGGGQERGLRSGTVPAPLAVGFGEACRIACAGMAQDAARIGDLRNRLIHRLRTQIPGLAQTVDTGPCLPGAVSLRFPWVRALDLIDAVSENLCVSTGSACTSADIAPSHVLTAMGLSPDQAARTLRLGIGRFTSAADIDRAADLLTEAHANLARAGTSPGPGLSTLAGV